MSCTKRFFGDNLGVIFRVVDNSRVNEVAIGICRLSTNRHLVSMLLDVVEECLDLLVLHRVLDGAKEYAVFGSIAHFQRLGVSNHSVAEFIVDGRVDVDALEAEANLETLACVVCARKAN